MSNSTQHCAPGRGSNNLPTCLSKDELLLLVKQYNRKFKRQPIPLHGSRQQLYTELQRRLGGKEDYNLLEHNFMKPIYSKVQHAFRPPKPLSWRNDPDTWLSNFEIDNAMKIYEHQYTDFAYLGTFPVDCPMGYKCPLSGMSVRRLMRQGVKRIGVVFNLDYHYQGGSHWVAFFSDLHLKSVEYFDSYGQPPPVLIKRFMIKVAKQLGPGAYLIYNDRRHQYGSSECGIYSMVYIASRLAGKSPHDMTSRRIADKEMFQMRNHFFRKSSNRYSDS